MGKWATKRQRNTLKNETYRVLKDMYDNGKGRSKKSDKENAIDQRSFIYSSSTFLTYKKEMNKFIKFMTVNYPEVKRLRKLKEYANEYLQTLINQNKSAYSIATAKAAIAKTLGLDYSSFIETPKRERKNIKRSRKAEKSKHISQEKFDYLSKLTSATGLRRRELQYITGESLFLNEADGNYYLRIEKGAKGGRTRVARIVGKNDLETKEIVQIFKNAGKMRLVPKLSSAYDNHHFRADYAKRVYNLYARNIEDLEPDEKYIMRKDRRGEVLDKYAMKITSEFLGHSRIDVIAQSYLYI